jgi:hypothetical protein
MEYRRGEKVKRWLCYVFGLSLCLAGLGCGGNIPVNEIATAKLALETARDAQAQVYARDEYRAAEKTLKLAEQEVVYKNYKRALILSQIASLQANYALALTNWKVKAQELKQAQEILQKTMEEAEQARLVLEEAKKQLQ